MSKLKPCPFCGGEAKIQKDTRYPKNMSDGITAFEPVCPNPECPIYMSDSKYYRTEAEAITAWNTRAETAKLAQIRACIESYRIKKNESDPFEYGRFQEWRAIKTDIDEILEGEK